MRSDGGDLCIPGRHGLSPEGTMTRYSSESPLTWREMAFSGQSAGLICIFTRYPLGVPIPVTEVVAHF